jgi:hypothetical protein
MKKVSVTARNFHEICSHCLRQVGDVGKVAYSTTRFHGSPKTKYCAECGPEMEL